MTGRLTLQAPWRLVTVLQLGGPVSRGMHRQARVPGLNRGRVEW
jgi:hypothetical protein